MLRVNGSYSSKQMMYYNYYQTYWEDGKHGYNMTRGGDGHRLLQIEDKDLIDLWEQGLGTIEIAAYFNCDRQAIRSRLLSLGYSSKDLIDRRQQKAVKSRYNNSYDKEEILTLWNQGLSATKIGQKLNYDRHSVMRILYQLGITEIEVKQRQVEYMVNSTKKPIIQYNKQEQYIKEWPSISDAAKALHLHTSNISKVLSKQRKTTGGYIFKYKEIDSDE